MALLDAIPIDVRDKGVFNATSEGAAAGVVDFITTDLYVGSAACRILGGSAAESSADFTWTSRATLTSRSLLRLDGISADTELLRILADIGGRPVRLVWVNSLAQATLRLEADDGAAGWVTLATHDWSADYVPADKRWILIEISIDDAGGANKWWLRTWLLGKQRAAKTSESTNANIVGNWNGVRWRSGGSAAPLYVSQPILDGTYKADLGPHLFVQVARPTSDNQQQWTRSVGADNFALVDETPPNDTDFVSATADSLDDRYEVTDVDAPAAGGPTNQVLAVAVGFYAKNVSASGLSQMKAQIRDSAGALIQDGTLVTPGVNYGSFRSNAFNATARTKAAVDGFRAGIVSDVDALSREIRCSAVWMWLIVDGSSTLNDLASGVEPGEALNRSERDTASGTEPGEAVDRREPADVAEGLELSETNDYADADAAAGFEISEAADRVEVDTGQGVEPVEGLDRQEISADVAGGVDAGETLDRSEPNADIAAGVELPDDRYFADTDASEGIENPEARDIGEIDTSIGTEPGEGRAVDELDTAEGVEPPETRGADERDFGAGAEAGEILNRTADVDTATGTESDVLDLAADDAALGHDGTSRLDTEVPAGYLASDAGASSDVETGAASSESETGAGSVEGETSAGSGEVEGSAGGFDFEGG